MRVINGMKRAVVDTAKIFADPELRGLLFFAIAIIAIGCVFYMSIEGWDFVQSLYFCVTSLATVSYGDLYPTSDLSRLFTTGYILVGVGFILSLLNVVARQVAHPMIERINQRAANQDSNKSD
jgi:voltage-gated potassium channel